MGTRRRRAAAVLLLGIVVLAATASQLGRAQTFSPYSDFEAMGPTELETLQVKLTFVGEQGKNLPTVAFTSSSNTLNVSLFEPYRRPDFHYENDNVTVLSCAATTAELASVVDRLGDLPAVRAGQANGGYLSVALFNDLPSGDKAFEAILTEPSPTNPDTVLGLGDARQAHAAIIDAVAGNAGCRSVLRTQWQALGFDVHLSLNPDSDGDGLVDADEAGRGTDAGDPDSDDDGASDGTEVEEGTDPLNPFNRRGGP